MKAVSVASSDGTTISAYEWGNPHGRELLFVHGFCQSHLAWLRQVADPGLASRFRMVGFDLRGHGASGKPLDRDSYEADALWGDDVAAVIAATCLDRPILVGWSYGGRVIADYLNTHGAERIAGINYVNARCSTEASLFGSGQRHLKPMQSDDLSECIAATRAFLRDCFAQQPTSDDFETMVGFNMVVPAAVRRHVLGRRNETTAALAALKCPVLITHGTKDEIILTAMAQFVAATVSGARLSLYENCGHAPFWEDAPRFNRELAAFADAVQ